MIQKAHIIFSFLNLRKFDVVSPAFSSHLDMTKLNNYGGNLANVKCLANSRQSLSFCSCWHSWKMEILGDLREMLT